MTIKETIFRALAVAFFIATVGTMGSLQWGFISYGRAILQTLFCMGGMVLSHRIANAIYISEKRKRKAVRK